MMMKGRTLSIPRMALTLVLLAVVTCFLCGGEAHALPTSQQRDLALGFDEKNGWVYSGDTIFTLDQWSRITDKGPAVPQGKGVKRSAGIAKKESLWTDNVMYYHFSLATDGGDDAYFKREEKNEIRAAMDEVSRHTCIVFKENATATNRVKIQDSHGCHSHVGMIGGVQQLGLAKACRTKHVILHHLGHLLGLRHEMNRPDRDEYVRINYENIPDRREYHFRKFTRDDISDFDIPYDYYSIMHYPEKAFTANGQVTIETLDTEMQGVIGTQKQLSFGDIKTINLLYDCANHAGAPQCNLGKADCPKEGFVGKDCTCWCPGTNGLQVNLCDQ